jgi:hypothetical protein
MKNYEIKQNKYKKSIEVLHELIERKKDQIYDNPKDVLNKKHLESLRYCLKEAKEVN